jgi:DNA-binding phage protein
VSAFGMGGGGMSIGRAIISLGVGTNGLRSQVRAAAVSIRTDLSNGTRGMSTGLGQASKDLNQAAVRTHAAAQLLKLAAVGLGAGVAGGIAMAVKAAVQYESAFAGVAKTVNATKAELEGLSSEIRAMSKQMPTSAADLAKIGESAGALGVAVPDIKEFIRVVAMIGSTTNVSIDEAATSLGQLSNVLGLSQKDYARFAATLVDLGNKGASTEKQILEIAARSGGGAAMIHLGTDAVLAMSSAVANLGIEVEAGGTSLQRFYLDLFKFVNAGSGITAFAKDAGMSIEKLHAVVNAGGAGLKALSERTGMAGKDIRKMVNEAKGLDKIAEVTGMTAESFRQLFAEDPARGIETLLVSMSRLSDGERMAAFNALGWSKEVRIMRMVMGLTQKGAENLTNSLNVGASAWENNTAAQAEFEKRNQTTASQFGLLKNIITDLMITLGTGLLPVIVEVAKWLGDNIPKAANAIADVWNTVLQPALKPMIESLMAAASAIGDLLFNWSGGAVKGPDALKNSLGGIAKLVAVIAGYVKHLADGLTAMLSNPVINGLARVAVIFAGLALSAKIIGGVVGGIKGGLSSFARMASFGKVGGAQQDPSMALTGAAKAHVGAAGALTKAAGALSGVGKSQLAQWGFSPADIKAQMAAQYKNRGGTINMLSDPSMAAAGGMYYRGGDLVAIDRAAKAEYLRNRRAVTAAGENMVKYNAARLMDGIDAGVRSVKSGARSLVGGAGSLIAKAFVPLMVADLVASIAAPMIGDALSSNPQWKRTAEAWKKGWIDGLSATFEHIVSGTEEFINRPESFTIAGRKLNTRGLLNSARANGLGADQSGLGVDPALLDTLANAAEGSFEQLQAQRRLAADISSKMLALRTTMEANVRSGTPWTQAQVDDLLNKLEGLGVSPTFGPGTTTQRFSLYGDNGGPGTRDVTTQGPLDMSASLLAGNQAALELNQKTTEALRNWLATNGEKLGLNLAGGQVMNLSGDSIEKLGHLIDQANAGTGLDPNLQAILLKYAAENLGAQRRPIVSADEWSRTHGGMQKRQAAQESLAANTAEAQKQVEGFRKWLDEQSKRPTFEWADKWITEFGTAIEKATGGGAKAKIPLISKILGIDAGTIDPKDEALIQSYWQQVLDVSAGFQKEIGLDQKKRIAEGVRATIAQGLKDGLSLSAIMSMLGPGTFELLKDGIGNQFRDVLSGVGGGIAETMSAALHAASKDPKLTQAAVDLWNSIVPKEMQIPASAKNKLGILATKMIDTLAADIANADTADERNAVLDRLRAMFPKDPRFESWETLVKAYKKAVSDGASDLQTTIDKEWARINPQGSTPTAGGHGPAEADYQGGGRPRSAMATPLDAASIAATVQEAVKSALEAAALAQAGKSVAAQLAEGMQSPDAFALLRDGANALAGTLVAFFPHSPATEGPLVGLFDWGVGIVSELARGAQSAIGLLGDVFRSMPMPDLSSWASSLVAQVQAASNVALTVARVTASEIQALFNSRPQVPAVSMGGGGAATWTPPSSSWSPPAAPSATPTPREPLPPAGYASGMMQAGGQQTTNVYIDQLHQNTPGEEASLIRRFDWIAPGRD